MRRDRMDNAERLLLVTHRRRAARTARRRPARRRGAAVLPARGAWRRISAAMRVTRKRCVVAWQPQGRELGARPHVSLFVRNRETSERLPQVTVVRHLSSEQTRRLVAGLGSGGRGRRIGSGHRDRHRGWKTHPDAGSAHLAPPRPARRARGASRARGRDRHRRQEGPVCRDAGVRRRGLAVASSTICRVHHGHAVGDVGTTARSWAMKR